ncbi:MAG: heparinase II/III family protein [Opitutaceae bacterium]|nr:heparinase II/III family protein [Opitutaceae bacterium]
MHKNTIRLLALAFLPFAVTAPESGAAETESRTARAARTAQLADWIAATPREQAAFTPSFDDRAFWAVQAALPSAAKLIRHADSLASQPVPVLSQELYDDFKKTGQRKPFERPYGERIERLNVFVLAFGLASAAPGAASAAGAAGAAGEGGGGEGERFLPLVERELAAILDEPSWVMSAHAGQYKDGAYVDLGAGRRAWELAAADWLLGERLSGDTRKRIRKEVRERALAPYLERARAGDARGWWWFTTTNNWNAVCHASVLGTALLLVEDAGERAEFAAAFESGTRRFISGFGDDGFCHEGLGYWNYGFGHYVAGAEALRRATGGRVDLLAQGKVRRIAEFGARWQIAGNVYPAFSDVVLSARPAGWLADFIAVRFGLGAVTGPANPEGKSLFLVLFDLSLPRTGRGGAGGADAAGASAAANRAGAAGTLPLRDWFPDGGALVVRRQPAERGLAAAFKGGHNGQPHNHNYLGSFVIMCDGRRVLTDLGGDVYVKDTFGPKRYTSGVLNSFGHPVPRVAGKLQRTGAAARAATVRTDFTDTTDVWEIDLTSAYDVPGLERLTRTFVFSRTGGRDGRGGLEITDRVRFRSGTEPQTFGTAIILRRGQKRSEIDERNRCFVVREGKAGVGVFYEAENGALTIGEEPVHGIVPDRPPVGTRVGIELAAPVHEAAIRVRIVPLPPAGAT